MRLKVKKTSTKGLGKKIKNKDRNENKNIRKYN
jgi:hypothetical protein